jgi:adenosylhomocysteine nucleosidase
MAGRAQVAVLAPMPSELRPVVRRLGLAPVGRDGVTIYGGAIGEVDVVATRTGIGTRRARETTERMLGRGPVDHVVVVGIAGGMGTSRVGDVVFPEVVVDKDSGAEYRPAPLPGVTARGRLVTHDDFDMGADELRRLVAEGFVAVDMETAAVAEVCARAGCPWSAVRVISDIVGVTPGDVIDLANADGSPNLGAAVRYVVRRPWRIPRLLRLGRDSAMAAGRAAATTERVLRELPASP